MLEKFSADIDRYVVLRERPAWFLLATEQGLWALGEHRFSHWVHYEVHRPILRQLLKSIGLTWHKVIETTTGISINCCARIGRGLYIGHFGGIFINEHVVMGENCNVSQGVTVGSGGRGVQSGCPHIGNRVFIGPGAKVLGPVVVGDDVAIGANAVVTKDLPDNAVAVGIPARIVSDRGSKEYVIYRAPS